MSWQSGKTQKHAVPPVAAGSLWGATLRPLAGVILMILAAAFLANSMTKDVSRDEQMYCTAGVLLGQDKLIYRDFSYPSQLPYHPLLLAAVYRSLGTTHYLLAGRLVSVACDLAVMLLILLIYRSLFGACRRAGLLFGLAAVILYAFNPLVDYAAGYAWNHDVVILCVVLSLWLLFTTDFQRKSRFGRVGAMGALLTCATCMRVTTLLVELLFLAAVLWLAGGSLKNRGKTTLPFLLAALVVALWPTWVIAQAPQAFRLNLVHIPTLYGQWLHEKGLTFGKLPLTVASLRSPGYLILLALAGYLLWAAIRRPSSLDTSEKRKAVFAAVLPLVFVAVAYIPPTMWQQYLAMPVPFIIVALAYPLASLARGAGKPDGKGRYRLGAWLVGLGVAVGVLTYPIVLYRSLAVLVPETWAPLRVHRTAQELAAPIPPPRLVLTLGPLYALEGACTIYSELSCGSIVYRIADRMTPEQRQITHTVGPNTLPEMLVTHPPTAVIVGVERSPYPKLDRIGRELEEPLRQSIPAGWRSQTHDERLQVYLRP